MRERTIGDLIYKLRIEKNVTQKQLCDGVCSVQTLSKIESGERTPDVFTLEYLFQRLGVSLDDLEVVLFDDEFREIEIRDKIEKHIRNAKWNEVEEILETAYGGAKVGMQGQYYWQMKAILASANNQHRKSIEYISKALECTDIEWRNGQIQRLLLSTREIELLCMLADEYVNIGKTVITQELTVDLLKYLEDDEIQEMELVKTYPKVVYLNSRFADSQREKVASIERCERALELLVNCDSTVFLAEIMELLIYKYKEMNLLNKKKRLEKQLNSLEQLFQEYRMPLYVSRVCDKWFVESYRKEYLLCEEIIKGERLARGLRCKELIEGIYEDPETLVRIENGSQSPSFRKYQLLMKRLNLNTEKYIGELVSEKDLISKCSDRITQFLIKHNYEDAKLELEKMKLIVDDNDGIRKQYIEKEEAFLDYMLKQIDEDAFIDRENNALKRTYMGNLDECIRIPTLSEANIINYMFLAYREKGIYKQSLELHKKVIDCYRKSKVKEQFHYRSLTLLYRSYLLLFEEMGDCDAGLAWSEILMKYELSANRGQGLDYICTEIMSLYEKHPAMEKEAKKKAIEKYLQFAFYLSDLFQRKSNNRIIDEYYRKNVDSFIQWY